LFVGILFEEQGLHAWHGLSNTVYFEEFVSIQSVSTSSLRHSVSLYKLKFRLASLQAFDIYKYLHEGDVQTHEIFHNLIGNGSGSRHKEIASVKTKGFPDPLQNQKAGKGIAPASSLVPVILNFSL
jgi:hypothetical protein